MASQCVVISDSEEEPEQQQQQQSPVQGESGCRADSPRSGGAESDASSVGGGEGRSPRQEQSSDVDPDSDGILDDLDNCDDEFDIFACKLKDYERQREEADRQIALEDSQRWAALAAGDADGDDDGDDTPICLTPQSPAPTPEVAATPARTRRTRRSKRRRPLSPDDGELDTAVPPVKRNGSLISMLDQLSKADDSFVSESPGKEPVVVDSAGAAEAASETFTVRVQAGSRIVRLQMRRDEELRSLFLHVASELAVPLERVCLGQRDIVYRPDQTPDDVTLGMFDVIEFWEGVPAAAAAAAPEPDGRIELHVQSAQRRSKVALRLLPTQTMQQLMEMYAGERGLGLAQLRFRFDGEALDPAETPESLGLEEGDCIDVHE